MAAAKQGRERISVFIVDDHRMVGQMMSNLLSDENDIVVLGWAGSIAAAQEALELQPADVVLMDYQLPDGDGVTAARDLRVRLPETRVIIVTGLEHDDILRKALSAGCSGYLLKTEAASQLAPAVRAAHGGSTAISPQMLERVMIPSAVVTPLLTPRELEVLELMVDGATSTEEMAERLNVSVNTLRNHTQHILEKMQAHTRLEAVTRAIRAGLVQPPR
jgi:two-component system response regulator DevR